MNQTLTIAKRELTSLFFSPIAYVAVGVFALIASLLFFLFFGSGEPAEIRNELGWIVWLLAFIIPAISMRLITEEFRSGTIEMLMTAPITDTQLIVGKWLGAMGFLLALFSPLVAHVVVLEINAAPDYGPIVTGFVGLIAVGGLYMAIGTFASAATQNQVIAFLLTLLITGLLSMGMGILASRPFMPDWLQQALFYINVDSQFADFAKGLIDTSNFVYFLSGIALFLFLAVKVLESRRWR